MLAWATYVTIRSPADVANGMGSVDVQMLDTGLAKFAINSISIGQI